MIDINTNTQTALSPSAFGMPAYGPTSGVLSAVVAPIPASVSTCVRTRHDAMGLVAKGDFPGTRAWRPPTC